MKTNVRILIADDHEAVREGVRVLIEREQDWQVCGAATNGRDAVELAVQLQPDVILVDLLMPLLSGAELVRELHKATPKAGIVVFSSETSEEMITQLFPAGAKSFVPKSDAAESLVKAIRAASQGKPYFTFATSRILFSRLLEKDAGRTNGSGKSLSARERQIIRHVALGRSNKQTADVMGVSTRTIETHRAAVMRKLAISSTAELVRYAVRNRIVEA